MKLQKITLVKTLLGGDASLNNGLHWTTIISEKLLLAIIGAITMVAVGVDLRALWLSQTINLSDLFLFFIYAEIIGMVGAFYASRRIPVTLPIIIAITALCRTIIGQGKEAEPIAVISSAGAVLILAGAAYLMSLKDKLSLEKKALREAAAEQARVGGSDNV